MTDFANGSFEVDLSSWNAGKTPITLGAMAWWDASQESFSDNDAIGTMTDQTGNGYDMVQTNESLKPIFKEGIVNGMPVMRNNGTKWMTCSGDLDITGDNDYDVFTVASTTTASSLQVILGQGTANSSSNRLYCGFDSGQNLNNSWWSSNWAYDTNISTDTFYLLEFGYDAANSLRYIGENGALNTNSPGDRNATRTSAELFSYANNSAGNPLNGDCGEVAVFNSFQSAQNRCYINSYHSMKYGRAASTNSAVFTRDTVTTYNGGDASLHVVTPSTNGLTPIWQKINVGAGNYKIIFYARSDGSEVTASDVKVWINSTSQTPDSFTSMGSGWYKVEYAFTGADEIREYGAEVGTNVTINLDEFSIMALSSFIPRIIIL